MSDTTNPKAERYGSEDAWPTPQQWVNRFLDSDDDGRIKMAERAVEGAQEAARCFLRNHDALMAQMDHLHADWVAAQARAEASEVMVEKMAEEAHAATERALEAEAATRAQLAAIQACIRALEALPTQPDWDDDDGTGPGSHRDGTQERRRATAGTPGGSRPVQARTKANA